MLGPPHFKTFSSVSAAFYSPKVEVPKVTITQVNIIINTILKNIYAGAGSSAYRQIMSHFNFTAALCSYCHFLPLFQKKLRPEKLSYEVHGFQACKCS